MKGYYRLNKNIIVNNCENKYDIVLSGTKWCGAGNNAYNYTDLGLHRETDMCCREHDYCDDLLESGQTKHNLTNNSQYTK